MLDILKFPFDPKISTATPKSFCMFEDIGFLHITNFDVKPGALQSQEWDNKEQSVASK